MGRVNYWGSTDEGGYGVGGSVVIMVVVWVYVCLIWGLVFVPNLLAASVGIWQVTFHDF